MSTALDDKVKEITEVIDAKRTEAQAKWKAFDDLRTEISKSDVDLSDESSEAFQKAHDAHREYGELADEISALEQRREALWAMTSEKGTPKIGRETREEIKDGLASQSLADRIVGSEKYQALLKAGAFKSTASRLGEQELGQLMSRDELYSFLASGNRQAAVIVTDEGGDDTVRPLIQPEQRGLIEPRFRPLLLRDLITIGTTDSDSIEYVVETGYVNNAAGVPEATTDAAIGGAVTNVLAGLKPQSRLSFEKKSQAVVTLAHWIAATRKSLGDVARLRTTIEARLRRGLDDVIEDQIMTGTGEDEQLLGILNTEGIQHQERGAGPLVDDILRAMTKVELAFFQVTATGLNSLDWQDIRLTRENEDGTGAYLFGPPSQAGATTLWGRPVVAGPQFPQDQPVVGDWRVVEFLIREGVQVLASDSHADFFVRNLVAILAEMQGGLIIPQPEALCEVSDATS